MGRLFNAMGYLLKGISLKTLYRDSVSVSGLGRIAPSTKIITKNNGKVRFSKNVRICENSSISCDGGIISVGENVGINKNMIMSCHGEITIGSNTLFAPNVCIYDHNHKFDKNGISDGYSVGSVRIGSKCWIGVNAIILRNTVIGDGCIIGAGCIVSGVIPPHSIVTSNRELRIVPVEDRK